MISLIQVRRHDFHKDWTRSNVYIGGLRDGYAVEDEIRAVKVKGETAIDYGTYKLGIRQSPKFSKYFLYSDSANKLIETKHKHKFPKIKDWRYHDLIWVKEVPKFQYILIHWGNTDKSTAGCLIVGNILGVLSGRRGVLQSKSYYKKMYAKVYQLIKAGGQTITYRKEGL